MNNEPPVIQTNQTYKPVPNPTTETNQKRGDIFYSEEEKTEKTGNEAPELESAEDDIRSSSTTVKERKASEEDKEELDDEKHKHSLEVQLNEKDQKQHQQSYTATQQIETTSSAPVKVTPSQTPPRLPPRPQKKRRKHRNRISKAVMRALLM
ncbi:uncharacterized protein pdgfbb [Trichomycterus rosablanca]|uniref:uncharacterized protein pdgfbb n=1 Tax=Trichomycterus rosablanca TaxID=2290929 RepID=UPI002F3500A7